MKKTICICAFLCVLAFAAACDENDDYDKGNVAIKPHVVTYEVTGDCPVIKINNEIYYYGLDEGVDYSEMKSFKTTDANPSYTGTFKVKKMTDDPTTLIHVTIFIDGVEVDLGTQINETDDPEGALSLIYQHDDIYE